MKQTARKKKLRRMRAGYFIGMSLTVAAAIMATVNIAEAAHVSDIIIPVEETTEAKPRITLNETEPETIENFDEAEITVIETTESVTESPESETKEPESVSNTSESVSKAVNLSSSDQNMLLRIAMAEAEDQGTEGMALVMNVVLNRVSSSAWPNSIEGVIYQKGQFEVISNGRYNRVTPSAACYEALDMVLSGWDGSQGAEYFCMAGESRWHENHLTRLFQYKSHVFYK